MPIDQESTEQVGLPPEEIKSPPGRASARRVEKIRKRIENMFTDIDRSADESASESPDHHLKQSALRNRLLEMETQLPVEVERPTPPSEPARKNTASPIVFEPDRIGYSYTGEQLQEIRGAAAPASLAPTVSVPLTAGGQTIGEVQLTAPDDQPLASDAAGLVNAVAQQVSLQIQNLRLLAATERARSDAEAATRRFSHEGWENYLDAIQHDERLGYSYDQDCVNPYIEEMPGEVGYHVSMDVMDEQIGGLYMKTDPAHPLSTEEKDLAAGVARQISQQVENLRLLADASRARAQAEELTRRMTRDSWHSFAEGQEDSALSYVYDSNRVIPRSETSLPKDVNFTQPITVNGEPIGELAVMGGLSLPLDAASLAAGIAAQASVQIETLRLTEELRKRAAELQELDRLKSAFLANMSHELRTPLNSILGFSDVILEGLDGPLTDNMNNDLQLIQKNGQHLLHLINDVLDMAKITAGRMNLSPERFRIQEIFDDVANIASPLANAKAISLQVEENSDMLVEIYADRTRIRQVMINVVNNALKFTDKGDVRIRADRRGENILIQVRDTGMGIPPEKLEAIFQEFTQVDTSSTRKAGGTGLGLPISRKLIEMHGGRIWAESTGVPGKGTTLFVELPLEARLAEPVEKQER